MQNRAPQGNIKRLPLIDVVRGIAIFGIFVMNLHYFIGWDFISLKSGEVATVDKVVAFSCEVIAKGKFYTLFSVLFGVGFAIQQAANPIGFTQAHASRMAALLAIGMLHLLIWEGDILMLYAVCGLPLLLFVNRSSKRVLSFAAVIYCLPIVAELLRLQTTDSLSLADLVWMQGDTMWTWLGLGETEQLTILREGTLQDLAKMNLAGMFYRWSELIGEGRPLRVFGLFLFGLWLGRRLLDRGLPKNTIALKRIALTSGIVGLTTNILLAVMHLKLDSETATTTSVIYTLVYSIAVPSMALAYVSSLTLLWTNPKWQSRLGHLAPVGRTALTNYLLQTAIGVILFYGIGFGLIGRVGPASALAIATIVYAFQVILSKLWLRTFRQGPGEWLWRSLATQHPTPLLRVPNSKPESPGPEATTPATRTHPSRFDNSHTVVPPQTQRASDVEPDNALVAGPSSSAATGASLIEGS